MKKIILPRANPIVSGKDKIEPITIEISGEIKPMIDNEKSLASVADYYDEQAFILANALNSTLPQGIMEPLIVHLMKKRVSLYSGLMEKEPTNE